MLGTAFSGVGDTAVLLPTISPSTACNLKVNIGDLDKAPFGFIFNLYTVDWSDLLRGMDWVKALNDLYGITSSLSSTESKSRRLPDEFLLSADTFLLNVAQEECLTVHSNHRYTIYQDSGSINIPLAMSIRVKLHDDCETPNAHCLQITQGCNGGDSDGDVRCFSGSCGGQEVVVSGSNVHWKFPLQSNFQCKIDRVKKGNYIKLENRDTRITLSRDKGWQCAVGLARFDGGIHSWKLKFYQ